MTITPVEYVENGLDAHKVWEESQEVVRRLTDARRMRDELARSVKKARLELDEFEAELIDTVQSGYAKLVKPPSQAQIDRDTKAEVANSVEHRGMRHRIADQQGYLDAAETEVRNLESQARALDSRMKELAAILHFYAACKQAETLARSMALGNPAVTWPF